MKKENDILTKVKLLKTVVASLKTAKSFAENFVLFRTPPGSVRKDCILLDTPELEIARTYLQRAQEEVVQQHINDIIRLAAEKIENELGEIRDAIGM